MALATASSYLPIQRLHLDARSSAGELSQRTAALRVLSPFYRMEGTASFWTSRMAYSPTFPKHCK